MKFNRKLFLMFVIFTATCLTSCSKVKSETLFPKDSTTKESKEIAAAPLSGSGMDKNEKYTVIGRKASQNKDGLSYSIKYPQITGLADREKQKKINKIIKTEALKVLDYYKEPYGTVDVDIDYTVSSSSDVLSIQYSGLGTVSNAAHPDQLFYTTNIDIKNGKRIRLKDIVDTGALAEKFISGKFKALWPEQSEEMGIDKMKPKKLQKDFQEADSLDSIGTEKQSDVFSYFTKDALGISIPVPYAIGGHAEFEIKYEDIKDNIIKNDIWKEFIKEK